MSIKWIIILIFLLINLVDSKIVVIRDDDVTDDGNDLRWFTDLIIEKDAKCTYAVIPHKLTIEGVNYLKELDPSRFELATHGYDHKMDGEIQDLEKARNLMVEYFGKAPVSIAAPYSIIMSGYQEEALRLGYHSQLNRLDFGEMILPTITFNFTWENGWGKNSAYWIGNPITYFKFQDFKSVFDNSREIFVINVHHKYLYRNERAKEDISKSFDYMNMKGSTFMTEDELYNFMKNTQHKPTFSGQAAPASKSNTHRSLSSLTAFKRALNSLGVKNFSGSIPVRIALFPLQISDYVTIQYFHQQSGVIDVIRARVPTPPILVRAARDTAPLFFTSPFLILDRFYELDSINLRRSCDSLRRHNLFFVDF